MALILLLRSISVTLDLVFQTDVNEITINTASGHPHGVSRMRASSSGAAAGGSAGQQPRRLKR
jgi:hypothetical protein